MQEITKEQKIEILKQLVNDEEIVMLFDSMNNCFRPLWKTERDVQLEVLTDEEAEWELEQRKDYVATEKDIDMILENGILEWEYIGSELVVKIWW
jgi:hypothetical protein